MNRKIFCLASLFVWSVTFWLCASAHADDDWTIDDLGTLPGGYVSTASGINTAGWVVGDALTPGSFHAFLYDGTMRDLGTLPGGITSSAAGINAAGWVVGTSTLPGPPTVGHAFLYDGTMRDLGTLPGGSVSSATGINDAGWVVGYSNASDGLFHAFLYDGTMRDLNGDLGSPPEGAQATAINDAGWIVGAARGHAFLYDGTMRDLGTLPGGYGSKATGINAAGWVVGYSYASDGLRHAFVYDGTMRDLGALPGAPPGTECEAAGINDGGWVVGYCYYDSAWAVLYSDLGITDLSALPTVRAAGWERLRLARAINATGQIVGDGDIRGETHAFRLTPPCPPGDPRCSPDHPRGTISPQGLKKDVADGGEDN